MFHQAIVMVPTRLASPEDQGAKQLPFPETASPELPRTKATPTWTFCDIIDETRIRLALRGYRWE